MSGAEWGEIFKTLLTVGGAAVVGVLTGWLNRKSQKETTQINLLTSLVKTLQEERDTAVASSKQIPLWRRYAQKLRGQLYRLGAEPIEPDEKLEL